MIDVHDEKTIRCPRVGGEVNFRFCRFENNMLPCRFTAGCWESRIDITEFLNEHYSKEELGRIFAPPKPKVESLVGIIAKVRKENQNE